MFNTFKKTVSYANSVKEGVSAVMHPIQFVRDKIMGMVLSSFLSFLLKLVNAEFKQKLVNSEFKDISVMKEFSIKANLLEKIDAEALSELINLLKDSGNAAIENFGAAIHSLQLEVDIPNEQLIVRASLGASSVVRKQINKVKDKHENSSANSD